MAPIVQAVSSSDRRLGRPRDGERDPDPGE
jgi:hypothetical protein